MKWMLIIVVFGSAPVKTNLIYDSLDECLKAEDISRIAYANAFNNWQAWAKNNPAEAGYPKIRPFMIRRIGMENLATCIPHAATPG